MMLATSPTPADIYDGKVVGISDGDTVTVLDANYQQHRIRLVGIDAPEKRQPYGAIAKRHLASLIFLKSVTVETTKTDRYKRELGKLLIDGEDQNLKQVQAGLAWHYKQYAKEQNPTDRELYARAEDEARTAHLGLWHDKIPSPPWEFRHSKGGLSLKSITSHSR